MGARVIALLGSPLPEGNTAKLLDEAIRGMTDAGCEVEKIEVTSLKFKSCREIFYCRQEETCAMRDDITPLYEKFRALDGIIVASPVMTMGIPGMLKSFMDRFQVFFMAKYVRGESLVPVEKRNQRLGLYLGISGMNIPNVFDGAKLTVRAFFTIIDVKYWDDLLEEAYRKGREMGRLLG
jgi:multimeric flavodoxin WrbA